MQGNGGFRLVVRRGPQPNQVYELNKDIVALGRDITNDIVINDPEVSRHHCRMTRTPSGYTLEDLGSTNGTFINGQRVTGARPLVNGDMIGLGETVTLGYEGGAVQAPPPVSQQETMIGSTAQPPGYAAPPAASTPPQPQSAYAAPQPQQPAYGAPAAQQPYAPPAPGYEYYDYEEEGGSNTGRWVAIGCGCLAVACVIGTGAAAFLIDAMNLWCSVPFVPQLFNLYCP